jgi:hypothetical protein
MTKGNEKKHVILKRIANKLDERGFNEWSMEEARDFEKNREQAR